MTTLYQIHRTGSYSVVVTAGDVNNCELGMRTAEKLYGEIVWTGPTFKRIVGHYEARGATSHVMDDPN